MQPMEDSNLKYTQTHTKHLPTANIFNWLPNGFIDIARINNDFKTSVDHIEQLFLFFLNSISIHELCAICSEMHINIQVMIFLSYDYFSVHILFTIFK